MELSSPVASLVPSFVLNTVVTLGGLLLKLAAIPIRRVPFGATRAVVCWQKEKTMRKKPQRDGKANKAMLPVMRPDAAGIDIGATEILVAVPVDRAAENVRSFPTFTQDLYALADWLKECRVTTVAMESTGVYWIPLFQILEGRGFEVCLVKCAPCEERARPSHGCIRLPMVAVLALGGIIARVISPRAAGLRRALAVAASGEPRTDSCHPRPPHAEGWTR
jgi:Transposase